MHRGVHLHVARGDQGAEVEDVAQRDPGLSSAARGRSRLSHPLHRILGAVGTQGKRGCGLGESDGQATVGLRRSRRTTSRHLPPRRPGARPAATGRGAGSRAGSRSTPHRRGWARSRWTTGGCRRWRPCGIRGRIPARYRSPMRSGRGAVGCRRSRGSCRGRLVLGVDEPRGAVGCRDDFGCVPEQGWRPGCQAEGAGGGECVQVCAGYALACGPVGAGAQQFVGDVGCLGEYLDFGGARGEACPHQAVGEVASVVNFSPSGLTMLRSTS